MRRGGSRQVSACSRPDASGRLLCLARKIAALREHTSQTAHLEDLEDRIRGWVRWQAKAAQLDEDRPAEGFLVLDTR